MCVDQCRELLEAEGLGLPVEAVEALDCMCGLIRESNPVVSLVSEGDLGDLWRRHVADSLSLVGLVRRLAPAGETLVDIGSGSGFPAVPIKVLLPDIRLTLVERSEKKAAFLAKLIAKLGLVDTEVISRQFPREVTGLRAGVVTARAVEKPRVVVRDICKMLGRDSAFVCQSGDPTQDLPSGFHVEHVEDAWTRSGLRRGQLHIVSHIPVL